MEDGEAKRLVIKDSGIGMNETELIASLGTIAQSGAREFLQKLEDGDDVNPADVIGQFGVGFYSVFMVADEIRVISRSYRLEDEAAVWISEGGDSFRVETADKSDRGTEIHITLKKDAEEFASEWKLKQVIKSTQILCAILFTLVKIRLINRNLCGVNPHQVWRLRSTKNSISR